jgi:hypothetical protein
MSKRDYLKCLGFKTSASITVANTTHMTPLEYKQLEHLLAKLQEDIGGNNFCIIPHYIHDGYHIGIYSTKTGEPITSATGPSIEETVEKLKQSTTINDTTKGNTKTD